MAKYIDCDAAIALAKDIIVPTKSGYDYRHRCIDPQDLAELPAADVVEVVRCKDCFNRTKSGMCIQWSRYEKIVNTSDYAFCSWGVKIDV